jgi:multidrug efflux pump subunit AcrB
MATLLSLKDSPEAAVNNVHVLAPSLADADRMAERLRSVRGVSIVQVYGGRDRELRVEVEPERMQAFGITLDQGLARLAASNLARPVGDITERGERAGVYLDNQLASLEDLRHLVVGESKGRLI